MNVEIDNNSGFCFGVVYAIQRAEEELAKNKKLYCLGDIVHNSVEVKRLESKGLITIDNEEFKKLKNCKVLIRAHGEPAETYKIALENNITLIDASCPVVLRLQNKIKNGFDNFPNPNQGQIVIYGKNGHAEVNGLVGQTQGNAIVISSIDDLEKIDFSKPINLFSQTTKSPEGFNLIKKEIEKRINKKHISFISNDTICRQVSSRDKKLRNFAKKHNVIIFVSGKKSSNGKMLFEVCKNENPQTYFVSDYEDVNTGWFANTNSVGICGATSTPKWLMEKIANKLKLL
ncbi:MAG: 4-hydroxy-3-methylbut-2-enyl diphosphate reductase [Bacteroidales bacterium]|nr:4-hydroxy-3-methylbut-2-enyl diphosphate reductase [Bacteroidales bacterium]